MSIKILQLVTKSLFFALVFTILYVLLLAGFMIRKEKAYQNKVYPHVYANGVDFGARQKEEVLKYYEPINAHLGKIAMTVVYKDSVATFSGEMLGLHYDEKIIADQVFSIGRSPNWPTRIIQKYSTLLSLGNYQFEYTPHYVLSPIEEHLEQLQDIYGTEPKDALFEVKNGKVTAFRVHENGTQLNTKDALGLLETYLQDLSEKNIPLTLVVTVRDEELKPKITLSEANNFGILEEIGKGESNYRGSSAERIHNLSFAATKFHGVLIPPGEIFSYNRIVGDISVATGYKTAYVIKNGRTVLGDGGGVCQDSTTLFRAALNSGLPIVERKGHAYRVKYYENDRKPGFDATVYAPSVDFKFKNDTPAHILIQVENNRKTQALTFTFYGKSDGRRVELSDAKVYDIQPAPEPLYEETPTLPRGTTKQVDWAAGGAKSQFTYKVYSKSGEIMQDKVFYTAYRPWQAVYLVGIGG